MKPHVFLVIAATVLLIFCQTASADEIHDAVNAGNLDRVKSLVSNDPTTVNAREIHGWTPLFLAAGTGYMAMVEFLVANQADINAEDVDGDIPLHEAAGRGRQGVVKLLLANGAKVNAKNKTFGWTPLHRVAADGYKQGHKDVIDLLLANGADAGARDKEGKTPLQLAQQYGRKEMAQHLQGCGVQR